MFDAAALSTYPGAARGTPRPRLVAGLAVAAAVAAVVVLALAGEARKKEGGDAHAPMETKLKNTPFYFLQLPPCTRRASWPRCWRPSDVGGSFFFFFVRSTVCKRQAHPHLLPPKNIFLSQHLA